MKTEAKFLILGATGMAGHLITIYLKEKGYSVDAFTRKKIDFCDYIIGDAENKELLKHIIFAGEYDFVVNCIGILNKNAEDHPKQAVYLNSVLPHYLAHLTQSLKTQVIHLSTDCVFSGADGNYNENSFPDGNTIYDMTKFLGELKDNKNLTLRNSIIGPDINSEGIGLFNWFMKQSGVVNGYTNALWNGITTLELAKIIEYISQNRAIGLHHMVNSNFISKYDLLKIIKNEFCKSNITIRPYSAVKINKVLLKTEYKIDYRIPSYSKMISDLQKWIQAHEWLYGYQS